MDGLSWNHYISPGQCCYSISLHNPLIIVSVQGYLMFNNRVHLMLLILKQYLLPVYRFSITQTGLIVIKRKSFRNHTLFCTFAVLFFHFFVYLPLPLRQETLSLFFHQAHLSSDLSLFYFLRWVVACYLPFNIHSYQTFSSYLFQCPCKNLQSLSHKQSCQCPYSTAWPCYHI